MLRALGHNVRYIVDASNDHAWVEVGRTVLLTTGMDSEKDADSLDDKYEKTCPATTEDQCNQNDGDDRRQQQWLHLDPCEAAVGKNLLYQEWGKNIRCVLAFYVRNQFPSQLDETEAEKSTIPIVQDVTQNYTSSRVIGSVGQEKLNEVSAAIRDKLKLRECMKKVLAIQDDTLLLYMDTRM